MQHHFDIEIAQKFGINIAIFLDHMSFWIKKNRSNNHNFIDGAYWTHNTVEGLRDIFPYWTRHQMNKVLSDCKKLGLINKSNHNKAKYDRRGWYSLTEYAAKLLNLTISEKTEMDSHKNGNGIPQKRKPIPYTNPYTNPEREKPAPKRARHPLSENFKPDKKRAELLQETSSKVQLAPDELLTKFRNLQKRNDRTSLDWQAEFENFLISERPSPFANLKFKSGYVEAEVIRPRMICVTELRLQKEEREENERRKSYSQ